MSVNKETVWLSRKQLLELFDRDVKTIGKHINNVFKEKELERNSVVAKFATTANDGKIYNTQYYNLDVIISVGYRVKSQRSVKFRQWAKKVLKSYIQNGYSINPHKITEQRLSSLENDVSNIKSHIEDKSLEIKQGIFYNGQIFGAHTFVSDLIRSAKRSIILIDNYIDDTALTLLSKNQKVEITIYTHTISKTLHHDIKNHKRFS